jgi:putative two-component system response regulator
MTDNVLCSPLPRPTSTRMSPGAAKQPKILIVDDTPENIDLLGALLKEQYRRSVAINGEKALKIAASDEPPDLILLDIEMPGIDGYEVCRRLKADPATAGIPVIFCTAKQEIQDETKGLELGAVDYITKPVSPPIVLARVKTHVELKLAREAVEKQNKILEQKVKERTRDLVVTQNATMVGLASLAEQRDNETGDHIRRTQLYVRAVAEHLSTHARFCHFLDEDTIDLLYRSAPLHDIGKVGVRDHILLKPGKLTDEEYAEMKMHTVYGRDAIQMAERALGDSVDNSYLRLAREIAYTHHEKWDGTGYPQGLIGEAIPISGRLMAIADVYDALVNKRVYKPGMPHARAVAIMRQGKGTHFDPDVADAFTEIHQSFCQIALDNCRTDEERQSLLAQADGAG